jgi:hypothetical protein
VDEIEKKIKMGNSGHFAECLHSAKSEESLPSARYLALGKETIFVECGIHGTRQRSNLCRVPGTWHSAK